MGTGLRTRLDQGQDQIQTDGIQTARMLSTRERVLLALRDIQRDKHGSTMKDKTASGERAIGLTENSKTSNDCVAQGTSRTMGQSFTDDQESRTTEAILPLTTRMDMECQTLLPSEGELSDTDCWSYTGQEQERRRYSYCLDCFDCGYW